MNTTPEKPSPELLAQQVLELLADHIAANDRVVAAVAHAETEFPKEAERILTEHRQSLANLPTPKITMPETASELSALQACLSDAIYMWGTILTVLLAVSSGTLLFFILHR
jgi:hypothetical protein